MFDGSDFLALAENLLSQRAGDEAAERSAISRAYYAAFLKAREYLDRQGPAVPRNGAAHTVVWNRLLTGQGSVSKSVGQDGKRLKAWRRSADYDLPHPAADVSAEAQTAVTTARHLLANLATLP